MMRGVSHLGRRRPQAARPSSSTRRALDADMNDPPRGEIEVESFPLDVGPQAPPRCCACRSSAASSRSASRWRSASRRSASPPTRSCPRRRSRSPAALWVGTIVFALALAVGLFFVVPVGAHEPDQGRARLGRCCSGSSRASCAPRSSSATCRCSRACATCGACSSTTAPSTRRSPATRPASTLTPENAQRFSRLHPRCGTSFLLIVMIVAIFVFAPLGLPRLVRRWSLTPHRRRAADRRHLLRDHQVRRQAPPQALGPRAHVARACSSSSSPRASPTSTSSPSRSPRWRPCSSARRRASSPTQDLVGVEIAA